MAKKNKTRTQLISSNDAAAPDAAGKRATKKRAAKDLSAKEPGARASVKKKAAKPAAKKVLGATPAKKAGGGKKRTAGQLALTLPQAKARKLAGDLYQSAGLAFWAEAIEAAPAAEREILVRLQDAICDVADLLKQARSTNPKHLHLYCVTSFDRDGQPAAPRFITAAREDEALEIFKAAHKGEVGRRKPRAQLVPVLATEPKLHD